MSCLDGCVAPRALGWALILSALLSACSGASQSDGATPASTTTTAPAIDEAEARSVANMTLSALSKRRFDVSGCTPADARIVTEAVASAGTVAGSACSLLVARRPDKIWLVVVRAPVKSGKIEAETAQAGAVQAFVNVAARGEGIVHVEYKP